MFGLTVPHLDVNKNPSMDMKRNCENVIRFPLPGSSLKLKQSTKIVRPSLIFIFILS